MPKSNANTRNRSVPHSIDFLNTHPNINRTTNQAELRMATEFFHPHYHPPVMAIRSSSRGISRRGRTRSPSSPAISGGRGSATSAVGCRGCISSRAPCRRAIHRGRRWCIWRWGRAAIRDPPPNYRLPESNVHFEARKVERLICTSTPPRPARVRPILLQFRYIRSCSRE